MEEKILDIFRVQARDCAPYRQYIELLGVDVEAVDEVRKIPFLPIEIFRTHRVYCAQSEPEAVFSSSGTTGAATSRHYVASLAAYGASFEACFEQFYGSPSQYELRTLLPSYREGSSLLYMVDRLKPRCTGSKILLLGVSFALLEAARSGQVEKLPAGSIVMETGGMKGRGYDISREQLHAELKQAYGVAQIHSEYGMCELMSQAYSSGGGRFRTPRSMQIFVRKVDNPLREAEVGEVGGLNVIDMNNRNSCSFIATGDRGIKHADGSFEVLGRLEGEILRGCNMLCD